MFALGLTAPSQVVGAILGRPSCGVVMLGLGNNKITDRGIHALCLALAVYRSSVRRLGLSDNDISAALSSTFPFSPQGDNSLQGDEGAGMLAQMIAARKTSFHLSLRVGPYSTSTPPTVSHCVLLPSAIRVSANAGELCWQLPDAQESPSSSSLQKQHAMSIKKKTIDWRILCS